MKEDRYNFLISMDILLLLLNKEIGLFYQTNSIFNDNVLENLTDEIR